MGVVVSMEAIGVEDVSMMVELGLERREDGTVEAVVVVVAIEGVVEEGDFLSFLFRNGGEDARGGCWVLLEEAGASGDGANLRVEAAEANDFLPYLSLFFSLALRKLLRSKTSLVLVVVTGTSASVTFSRIESVSEVDEP